MNNELQRKIIDIVITCTCGQQLHYHIGKPCPVMPFTVEPCPNCMLKAELAGFDRAAATIKEG
jgi:hypothetical protein